MNELLKHTKTYEDCYTAGGAGPKESDVKKATTSILHEDGQPETTPYNVEDGGKVGFSISDVEDGMYPKFLILIPSYFFKIVS